MKKQENQNEQVDLISLIEELLKIQFPKSYRQFLIEKAPTEVAGFRILGLPEGKTEKKVPIKKSHVDKDSLFYIPPVEKPELPDLEELKEALRLIKERKISASEAREIIERRKMISKLSVLEASKILRKRRPDLPENLVAISFHSLKDKVLCLDLRHNPEEDCPLVETTLKSQTKLIPISDSFEEWIKEWEEKEKGNERFLAARQRVANRREEVERARGREFSHQPIKRFFCFY